MIKVWPYLAGSCFELKVIPGSRQTKVAGEWQQALKLKISRPPEKGEANKACCRFLTEHLDISENQLTIIKGQTGRRKIIYVTGLSPALLEIKLVNLLGK